MVDLGQLGHRRGLWRSVCGGWIVGKVMGVVEIEDLAFSWVGCLSLRELAGKCREAVIKIWEWGKKMNEITLHCLFT